MALDQPLSRLVNSSPRKEGESTQMSWNARSCSEEAVLFTLECGQAENMGTS